MELVQLLAEIDVIWVGILTAAATSLGAVIGASLSSGGEGKGMPNQSWPDVTSPAFPPEHPTARAMLHAIRQRAESENAPNKDAIFALCQACEFNHAPGPAHQPQTWDAPIGRIAAAWGIINDPVAPDRWAQVATELEHDP